MKSQKRIDSPLSKECNSAIVRIQSCFAQTVVQISVILYFLLLLLLNKLIQLKNPVQHDQHKKDRPVHTLVVGLKGRSTEESTANGGQLSSSDRRRPMQRHPVVSSRTVPGNSGVAVREDSARCRCIGSRLAESLNWSSSVAVPSGERVRLGVSKGSLGITIVFFGASVFTARKLNSPQLNSSHSLFDGTVDDI